MSVLMPLHTFGASLICFRFEMKNYSYFSLCIIVVVSDLSVTVVTVLCINLSVLLKRCFTRINTCLYELIRAAGEESVDLFGHISTLKHPQSLIVKLIRTLINQIVQ